MTVPESLLAILVCLQCKGGLDDAGDRLVCRECGTGWPVRDGVPHMLAEEAIPPEVQP